MSNKLFGESFYPTLGNSLAPVNNSKRSIIYLIFLKYRILIKDAFIYLNTLRLMINYVLCIHVNNLAELFMNGMVW